MMMRVELFFWVTCGDDDTVKLLMIYFLPLSCFFASLKDCTNVRFAGQMKVQQPHSIQFDNPYFTAVSRSPAREYKSIYMGIRRMGHTLAHFAQLMQG